MKKRILAFICAMTMVVGMSLSVCAATSPSAGDVVGSDSPSAGDVAGSVSPNAGAIAGQVVATPAAPAEELVSASQNATGQVLTADTMAYFAETTTITGVQGATLSKVSTATAKAMIAQAQSIAGHNTFIATIVDLQVPAGTGAATFTLGCPNVWAGQNVTILHQKADGSFENIKPDSVKNNQVTFTMTSYSPIAVVINTGAVAPKTGSIFALVAAMAAISGIGAAVCGKKAKED